MNQSIIELIKGSMVIGPEDSVRRASSLIRASDGSSLIVIDQGQILGTISEKAVAAALAQAGDPETALDAPVRPFIDTGLAHVNSGATVREAAAIFAANDVDMLPVINSYGGYQGVLYRTDLIGYMTHTLKLPPVAGMATPLGVYLTTGSVSGGAGSLGLFLTGVSLGLMVILSQLLVQAIMHLFGRLTGIPIGIYLASPPIGVLNVWDIPYYVSVVLKLATFALFMRLSPLSGYHAAEHMTVHTIESGDIITPDTVRRMPRVHPRCGTNLLAGASLFLIIVTNTSGEFAVTLAIFVVILGWRTVGSLLQQFITTRPPSEKELASGVAAGNQLVKAYHERPNYQTTGFERILKLGFLQTGVGMGLVVGLSQFIQSYFHIAWLIF